ncbi:hypothetical protein MKX03_036538 [Papaver bracteatum]|nr:hypothetical protein MKX03_036538 [Papaver bracteatum]
MQRHVFVDGKVRTDKTYVVLMPKTNENFRLLYETKGRFRLHSIKNEEVKVGLFTPFFMPCLFSSYFPAMLNENFFFDTCFGYMVVRITNRSSFISFCSATNTIITAKYHASVQLNTY